MAIENPLSMVFFIEENIELNGGSSLNSRLCRLEAEEFAMKQLAQNLQVPVSVGQLFNDQLSITKML